MKIMEILKETAAGAWIGDVWHAFVVIEFDNDGSTLRLDVWANRSDCGSWQFDHVELLSVAVDVRGVFRTAKAAVELGPEGEFFWSDDVREALEEAFQRDQESVAERYAMR